MKIASVVGEKPNFLELMLFSRLLISSLIIPPYRQARIMTIEFSEIFFKEFKLPKPDVNLEVRFGNVALQ